MDDFPASKIERGKIFAKTGLKVSGNYARYYLSRSWKRNNLEEHKQKLHFNNANAIYKELTKLRGTALKIAQSMSMDTGLLPDEFIDVMSNAQYRVPPMNRALVRAIIKREFGIYPEQLFKSFDLQSTAAASLGQVHIATIADGQKLAVKIQYPNIHETISSDLAIAKVIFKRIVKGKHIDAYFKEIGAKLLEETDYYNEGKQIDYFSGLYHNDYIITPVYVPGSSTGKVLTMSFIEGDHLDQFLKQNPSKEERDHYGQILWDFFNVQIAHESRTVYADIHPGNFLFREDLKLGIVDFGCVKTFPKDFLEKCILLFGAQISDDTEKILNLYYETEILFKEQEGSERQEEIYNFFQGFGKVVLGPFHRKIFNFGDPEFRKSLNFYFSESSKLNEVRGSQHFIFLNKVLFGLFSFLMKLKAEVDTRKSRKILDKAIKKIESSVPM
jgi:predicted unusual protein kinase regulating ubiquinone biosynthesis (AarF/ABC1/UbiB family)